MAWILALYVYIIMGVGVSRGGATGGGGGGGGAGPALAGPILILSFKKKKISFLNPKEVAVYVQCITTICNFVLCVIIAPYYTTKYGSYRYRKKFMATPKPDQC